MSTSLVTIAGITVRTDIAGRYSLNDLHQAAGGEKKHQPSDYLRLKRTQALITALKNDSEDSRSISEDSRSSDPVSSNSVAGTHVVKELVYDYAMWISAEFNLKVIRAYDALVTKQPEAAQPAIPAPNLLAEQLVTVHAGQIAELLNQQTELIAQSAESQSQMSRLIALIEQRQAAPTLPPAMLAPATVAPPPVPEFWRITVAAWLAKHHPEHTKGQKYRLIALVDADYISHGQSIKRTRNGFGLYSPARIAKNAARVFGAQKEMRF